MKEARVSSIIHTGMRTDLMKDFSNASFAPETLDIMKDAMDAAVASLPDPVSSAHVQSIARPFFAVPRMAREIPRLCIEWRY
jgi:hypothetical protein